MSLIEPNDPTDLTFVSMVTYRPLDTGDSEQDFLIRLGSKMEMVYGFRYTSNQWNRHDRRGFFDMTITEELGNLNRKTEPLPPHPSIEIELPDNDIKIEVHVPDHDLRPPDFKKED